MHHRLAAALVLATSGAALAESTDTLGMIAFSHPTAKAAEDAVPARKQKPSDLYIVGDVGLNLLQDVQWRDTGFQSDPKFQFKPGIDARLGLGIRITEKTVKNVTERFNMEISAGFLWNSIDAVSSSIEEFNDPLQTGAGIGLWGLSGGDGRMMQVPLTVDFIWTAYETEKISLSMNLGLGVQWTDFEVNNAMFAEYATPTSPAPIQSIDLNASGSSVAFRYQAGLDLLFKITDGMRLGGYFRYGGAAPTSLGRLSTGSPAPLGNLRLGALNNFSVGLRLGIDF